MKAFIVSICAILLLVGTVVFNGFYIKNTTNKLTDLANDITLESSESIENFKEYWIKNEHKICISVSHKDVDNINIAVCVLEEMQERNESDGFWEYHALLLKYIEEIRSKERVHIDNII